ncbi:MAG: hypothetical protein ABJE47_18275 [bacterium]
MWLLGIANRWFLLRGLPVLRTIPGVRDLPLVRGHCWIRSVALPYGDRRRLEKAVNKTTVAFLGPNHPEFASDWFVDKELSTYVAPRMASWADRGIVGSAPRFWGMNNLVSNDGGDAARAYSVEWALDGEAVLLHPEGTVRWTNDIVHPLFPGIAQMAMRAADLTINPVFIVPVVWKYQFVGDVSARLHREMHLIEARLGLATGDASSVAVRFYALQRGLLVSQMRRYGLTEAAVNDHFFERQKEFQQHLVRKLEQRYQIAATDQLDKRIARIARAIQSERSVLRKDPSPEAVAQREVLRRDHEMADEAKRLGEFSRDVYGTKSHTQEQIAESLKRIRDRMLRRHWKDVLAKTLPRPLGPRVLHIGVPEPIAVVAVAHTDRADYENVLLELTRRRMQERLDDINAQIEPDIAPYRVPNLFM